MLLLQQAELASAQSGWAPDRDVVPFVDDARRVAAILDGRGPTYGGHYVPHALGPVITALRQDTRREPPPTAEELVSSIREVVDTLSSAEGVTGRRDLAAGKTELFHNTLGITLAVLDPATETLSIAQIGLSRLYIVRNGKRLLPLFDHSLPTQVGRAHGFSSSAYTDALIHRDAVTRALGLTPSAEVDSTVIPVHPSDVIVICSSAVWNTDDGDVAVATLAGGAGAAPGVVSRAAKYGDAAVIRLEVATPIAEPPVPRGRERGQLAR